MLAARRSAVPVATSAVGRLDWIWHHGCQLIRSRPARHTTIGNASDLAPTPSLARLSAAREAAETGRPRPSTSSDRRRARDGVGARSLAFPIVVCRAGLDRLA